MTAPTSKPQHSPERVEACLAACDGIPTECLASGALGRVLDAAASLLDPGRDREPIEGWELDLLRRSLQELGEIP